MCRKKTLPTFRIFKFNLIKTKPGFLEIAGPIQVSGTVSHIKILIQFNIYINTHISASYRRWVGVETNNCFVARVVGLTMYKHLILLQALYINAEQKHHQEKTRTRI